MTRALVIAFATATIASTAQAHHVDPGPAPPEGLGDPGEQTADTDLTPAAKDSERWHMLSGAKFKPGGEVELVEGSTTSYETDLFAVSFRPLASPLDKLEGFAGGSVCRDPVPEGASGEQAREHTRSCQRVPAIHRYQNDLGTETFEPVEKLPGADEPGYVGAIAWIAPGKAMAVGGTGSYPRRELPRARGESDASWLSRNDAGEEPNAAGMGRAWLYENGSWRELEVPESMRGLTALDFSPRAEDCGEDTRRECGFAGGLRQLWRWRDGSFDKLYSDASPPEDLGRASLFSFRVRDLDFSREIPQGAGPGGLRALAVTSGCCHADPLRDFGWIMSFDGERWTMHQRQGEEASKFHQRSEDRPVEEDVYPRVRGTYNRIAEDPGSLGGFVWGVSGIENPVPKNVGPPLPEESPASEQTDPVDDAYGAAHQDADRRSSPYSVHRDIPESIYSIAPQRSAESNPRFYVLTTPGGPDPENEGGAAGEPASQIMRGGVTPRRGSENGSRVIGEERLLTTLRLHSMDGEPGFNDGDHGAEAVGVLRGTGQGAAFGAREKNPPRVEILDPQRGKHSHASLTGCDSDTPPSCQPDVQKGIEAQHSLRMFKLPSYALNSIDMLDTVTHESWAVGDHGAVMRLGELTGANLQASEPDPPRLGDRRPQEAPTSEPYDGHRQPLTSEPRTVPALASQPAEHLDEPRFVPYGGPDPVLNDRGESEKVVEVVMSRDGSEGWAIGGEDELALHHFDGASWARCDTDGIPGVVDPDPACEELAPLRRYRARPTDNPRSMEIYAASRVPLENDSDPTNDDDLEIVAVGEEHQGPDGEDRPLILRYSKGGWEPDEEAMQGMVEAMGFPSDLLDVAFTAPDDGWVVGSFGSNGGYLFHFDGERWWRCNSGTSQCDDRDGRIPPLSALDVDGRALRLKAVGERVYLSATRVVRTGASIASEESFYPLIIYRDGDRPCEKAGDLGCWRGGEDADGGAYEPIDGGYDPGFYPDHRTPENEGRLFSASIGKGRSGELEGWAVGRYGVQGTRSNREAGEPRAIMLRLSDGAWREWDKADASADYLWDLGRLTGPRSVPERVQAVLPDIPGKYSAFLFRPAVQAIGFHREHDRWEALPAPFKTRNIGALDKRGQPNSTRGRVEALAPDGQGGLWAAVRQVPSCSASGCQSNLYFYRYTDRPPAPLFTDVPHPATEERITGMASGADGSVWLGTDSNVLYRYDRLTGWDGVQIRGWDPGRVVTRPSSILALAVGESGEGIAVGEGGRIAEISPGGVQLDKAAGTLCDFESPQPPCGTGRNLVAAAVSQEGAAITAGRARAILYRPPGGEFRRIAPPPIPRSTIITGIALPRPDKAVLVTDSGEIWSADPVAGNWRIESYTPEQRLLTPGLDGRAMPLNAIALDRSGAGYAVGDEGVLLERSTEGGWRRIDSGALDNMRSVTLTPTAAEGALIGAENGGLYTLVDGELAPARAADPYEGVNPSLIYTPPVLGVAFVPGHAAGEAEAWAVQQAAVRGERDPVPQAVLHWSTDASDPRLAGGTTATPVPDSPEPGPSELSFAAMGKHDCQYRSERESCHEAGGTGLATDLTSTRVRDAIAGGAEGLDFALFTGDINDAAGNNTKGFGNVGGGFSNETSFPTDVNVKHRRWIELIADPLADDGLPLVGAIGGQDFSQVQACDHRGDKCAGNRQLADAGPNDLWRQTVGTMPAPWEASEEMQGPEGLTFERLPDAGVAEVDLDASGATGEGGSAEAPTHYAYDVLREGEPVARIAIADTSLQSLSGSDAQGTPTDLQERWLRQTLCYRGSERGVDPSALVGGRCTREPGQEAIVLTNTPTYTYATNIPPSETATDAATFEALMFELDVDAVVAGRLGWNGLYWTRSPLIHHPEPGQGYPEGEPEPLPGQPEPIPYVVAASAGGKFGPDGRVDGGAAEGFWHGYSVVHLDTETGEVRVEQRPVFDWVVLRGAHMWSARGSG